MADPRLLNPPAPELPESTLDFLSRRILGAPQGVWDQFTGKTPDPTIGGSPLMIPTEANLPGFMAKVASAYKDLPEPKQGLGGPLESMHNKLIQAYMAIRYPNRMAAPSAIGYEDLGSNIGGSFDPVTKEIKIGTGNFIPPSAQKSVTRLAHETQHAVDAKRAPSLAEGYSQAPDIYNTHPLEVRAGKAGQTATDSFNKFIEMINGSQLSPFEALLRNVVKYGKE